MYIRFRYLGKSRKEVNPTLRSIWTDLVIDVFERTQSVCVLSHCTALGHQGESSEEKENPQSVQGAKQTCNVLSAACSPGARDLQRGTYSKGTKGSQADPGNEKVEHAPKSQL